jgi:predicted nucleic acid-binding protein
MLAVSNTSPLRHLVAATPADLVFRLFAEVLIPPGVAAELSGVGTPVAVRQWIAQPPGWLRVCPLQSAPDAELMGSLDRGEREAIQLAVEQKADILIIDEWKGRAIADRRGLPIIGALGVLGDAFRRGLIDDPHEILREMRQHGFRINDQFSRQLPGFASHPIRPMRRRPARTSDAEPSACVLF